MLSPTPLGLYVNELKDIISKIVEHTKWLSKGIAFNILLFVNNIVMLAHIIISVGTFLVYYVIIMVSKSTWKDKLWNLTFLKGSIPYCFIL